MGAGASVSDLDELKAEYEKGKHLLPNGKSEEIEAKYAELEAQKKNEFLIIGKTRKMYQEAIEPVANAPPRGAPSTGGLGLASSEASNFLAKPKVVDAEEQMENALAAAEGAPPPPIEGVKDFVLKDLEKTILASIEAGKTPLICDNSEEKKVDTFFAYGGLGVSVVDGKKYGLQKSMQNKPVDEILEDIRKQLVFAMKGGTPVCLQMGNSVFDAMGTFNSADSFPLELFNKGGVEFINSPPLTGVKPTSKFQDITDNEKCAALFRDEEKREGGGLTLCREGFFFIVTSNFSAEDLAEFVFKTGEEEGFGLPGKDKFQVLRCLG